MPFTVGQLGEPIFRGFAKIPAAAAFMAQTTASGQAMAEGKDPAQRGGA
jgi:hypothetical protein